MDLTEGDVQGLLKTIKDLLNGVGTKYDSISEYLGRIETKINNIEQELNKTTKATYNNAKDVEFMNKTLIKLEDDIKDEIKVIWESGIRKYSQEVKEHKEGCIKSIKEHDEEDEKKHKKVKEETIKDVKLWLAGISLVLLANLVFTIITNYTQ